MGLLFGLLAAVLAYVIDTGYQRLLREQRGSASNPIIFRDTAGEDRLRSEIQRLNALLDTKKADEEARRKRGQVRTHLGSLLNEARATMRACLQTPPIAGFSCEEATNKWFSKAHTYIEKNLEPSYLSRFDSAEGLGMSWIGANEKTNNLLNFLNQHAAVLEQFIKELLN